MATSTTLTKKVLQAIVERLQAGAALIAESRALGFTHNGPLRTALRDMLGMEKYDALMAAKRPIPQPGAPKREKGDRPAVPLPDDKGLPLIESMRKADGWSWRHVQEHEPIPRSVELKHGTVRVMDTGDRILVMISPEGVEYTQAFPHEKANLLRVHPVNPEGPPSRFVLWEHSMRRHMTDKGAKKAEAFEAHVAAVQDKKGKPAAPTMPAAEPLKKAKKKAKMSDAELAKKLDAVTRAGGAKATKVAKVITTTITKEKSKVAMKAAKKSKSKKK